MNVGIVYGFLGAGKTTLIRHLLSTSQAPGEIAVLVNDFGRVNVDGAILNGQHVQVVPLASGCICCTLLGALAPAVEELHRAWQPQWLIIEPTGVAAPNALEALLMGERLARIARLATIVTVVDASRFVDYRMKLGEFYTAQVEQATTVLVNKADLVDSDRIAAVTAAVREHNLTARLLVTQFARADWSDVTDTEELPTRIAPGVAPPAFETCEVELPPMTEGQLNRFSKAMASGRLGQVVRAKAIALVEGQTQLLNYVDGSWAREPTAAAPTALVVVGHGLDQGAMRRALEEADLSIA